MNTISLCMVVANEGENLKELFPLVRPYVDEVLVIDQASTDDTREICEKYDARVMVRSRKFLADIDRQTCYNMAGKDWILALDADERPSQELLEKIKYLTSANNVDCYWFKFDNKVDGIDVSPVLGQEYHPRLWRKGVVIWPERAHTWPQIQSSRQCFIDLPVKHYRSFERIKLVHAQRRQAIDPQNQQVEAQFLHNLEQYLKTVRGNNGSGT